MYANTPINRLSRILAHGHAALPCTVFRLQIQGLVSLPLGSIIAVFLYIPLLMDQQGKPQGIPIAFDLTASQLLFCKENRVLKKGFS